MKEALPEVFDAWIRQYVEEIANVDTTLWEIYHRWGVINACIRGGILSLRDLEDGRKVVEEKTSKLEAKSEVFSSPFASENDNEKVPEPAKEA